MHMPLVRSCCAVAALCSALSAQTVTATPVDTLLTVGPATYDAGRQQPVMLRQIIYQAPLLGTLLCDLVTWNGADWVPILPQITLPMLGARLLHDPRRDRLVVFDGGQTLRYVAGTNVTWGPAVPGPFLSPPPTGRSLVLDLVRDELVVFGGQHVQSSWPYTTLAFHDETYVLRQGVWQQVVVANRPSVRSNAVFVYDPVRLRAVLFGGYGSPSGGSTLLGDTWEWDGTSWTQVAAIGPAPGAANGTYDPIAQRVVVRDAAGGVFAFDGAAWTPFGSGTMPPFSTANSALVHDGQALLLVGGWTGGLPSRSLIETWRLGAGGWQQVPTSVHMENEYSALMAYDTVRHELLCLHGWWMVSWVPGTTWTWNGTWREHVGPAPKWGGMAFDEARGEAVLFGGLTGGDTWTWNGASWTQRAPALSPPAEPAYSFARLAYDPLRQHVVLVGSSGTWLWDGTTWAQAPGSQPQSGSLLVWDPVRAAVVMSGLPDGSTWEWTGQWQQVSATGGPLGIYTAAFDPSRGHTYAYEVGIEHEWTGTAWVSRPLPVPMRLDAARSMVTDPDRGRVLFRGVIDPAQGIQMHVLGPTPSTVEDACGGCANGIMLVAEQRPAVGNRTELVSKIDPASVAIFGLAFQPASYAVGACTLVVDGSIAVIWRFPTASGRVGLPLPIAPSLALRGLAFYVQAGTLQGSEVVLSRALRLRIGD